jgi:ATP-dependent RNA circularization protein (DNA/RNA ligase family)
VKKVISACIDQVIQFDSEQEVDKFLEHLKSGKQRFTVVWKNTLNDGKVQIRIKKQYNKHFMKEGDE